MGTVLVKQGQLKLNNFFVAGGTWGRVRGLTDWLGRTTTKADPSTPVEVIGFKTKTLPDPGDDLVVVLGEEQAKQILDYRKERLHAKEALTDVVQASEPGARAAAAKQETEKALNVVIKADIGGTLQAGNLPSSTATLPIAHAWAHRTRTHAHTHTRTRATQSSRRSASSRRMR